MQFCDIPLKIKALLKEIQKYGNLENNTRVRLKSTLRYMIYFLRFILFRKPAQK